MDFTFLPKATTGSIPPKTKKPRNPVYLVVGADGSLRADSAMSADALRAAKLRAGDIVRAEISKPRNVIQWRKAHALGHLVIINIDEFERFSNDRGMIDAHGALKHLQFLSGAECDEMMVTLSDGREVLCRQARSLAFDSMDESEFQKFYSQVCQYIITRWWSDLDQIQIEQMAAALGV